MCRSRNWFVRMQGAEVSLDDTLAWQGLGECESVPAMRAPSRIEAVSAGQWVGAVPPCGAREPTGGGSATMRRFLKEWKAS